MRLLKSVFVAILVASGLRAQTVQQLTRITSTTGVTDSMLVAVCDSVRPVCRTRAVSLDQIRKGLSPKAFDSMLVTGVLKASAALNYFSGTEAGSAIATSGIYASRLAGLAAAAGPSLVMIRVNGSLGTPTALASGNPLGQVAWQGYDGTVIGQGPRITGSATEAWTATAHGSKLFFTTTANTITSAANTLILDQDTSATFGGRVISTGLATFNNGATIATGPLTLGTAAGAATVTGTAATGSDQSSSAITFNANTGTGTGTVGGFVFAVPVTTSTGTTAQTLTNGLVINALTIPLSFFGGAEVLGTTYLGTTTPYVAVNAGLQITRAAGVPTFTLNRVNGTFASPSIITNADPIGVINFLGFNSATSGRLGASITATATENWVNGTATGTRLTFSVTPNLTSTAGVALTLDQDKSATFAGAVSGITTLAATGPTTLGNGSQSAPAYSWTSETNSGWYRSATNDFYFAIAGSPFLEASIVGGVRYLTMQNNTRVELGDGTVANPSLHFANSSGLGAYRFGADTLGLATGGVHSLDLSGGASVKLRGGAGNFTLQCGTGNSRTCAIQSTTSSGVATTAILVDASQRAIHSASLLAPNGTLASPGYAFTTDTSNGGTGMYLVATNQLGFSVGGNQALLIQQAAGYTKSTLRLRGNDGTAGLPGYTFSGTADTTSGLYRVGLGVLGFAISGTDVVDITSAGLRMSNNGSAASPSYTFGSSTGLGFYRFGADTLGFATAGVHSMRLSGGAAATLVGGAGNFTLQCGTGNSRTCTFQSTTSSGTAKNTLVLGADSSVTSLGQFRAPDFNGSGGFVFSGATTTGMARDGNGFLVLEQGGNAIVTLRGSTRLEVSSAIGAPSGTAALPGYTFGIGVDTTMGLYQIGTAGANDTLGIAVNGVSQMKIGAAGVLRLPNLPAEGATKNAQCWDPVTFNATQNAGATCTISARRFKQNIGEVTPAFAWNLLKQVPVDSFTYRAGGRRAFGTIADDLAPIDERLITRDAKGLVNAANYEQLGILTLLVQRDDHRRIDSLITALRKKP